MTLSLLDVVFLGCLDLPRMENVNREVSRIIDTQTLPIGKNRLMIKESNYIPILKAQSLSSLVMYFSELITGFCMYLKKQSYERKLKDLVSKEKRKSDGQLDHLVKVLYSKNKLGINYTVSAQRTACQYT